ncbi:DUF1016 N-terminal domain-containing protein [Rhodoferax fermentans]|uniref:YhcG N-terminal domain-containing protein n=1 Tax=Rhodoferax fermentans TaxID=28066 RepID=A0A1T1AWE1_RHOFE|nr:DUF1016 N-terminal domain-containing protein [Rhodoferax fermentans]OOV08434.1 hypothetical protein RF819_18570 [Rhodoferax fermentans]
MHAFGDAWPDAEFVQAVLAQWPWYRQLALLDKLSASEDCRWYVAQAIEYNWVPTSKPVSPSLSRFWLLSG